MDPGVSPILVVILHIFGHKFSEMILGKRYDVICEFFTDGSNESFGVSVLPWTSIGSSSGVVLSGYECPERTICFSVPSDDSFWCDDSKGIVPVFQESRKNDPEDSITCFDFRFWNGAFIYDDLQSESEIFKDDVSCKICLERGKDKEKKKAQDSVSAIS